jgi:hypothetical protein
MSNGAAKLCAMPKRRSANSTSHEVLTALVTTERCPQMVFGLQSLFSLIQMNKSNSSPLVFPAGQ